MMTTYPAVLKDGRIEWVGEPPADLPADVPIPVQVTIFSLSASPPLSDAERKARRAAAMERGAARGGISSIPDPSEWQRQERKDRPLPGRE